MAHIIEFTVEGLAAQDKVIHRRLDRHVNIFWGLNGSGKTSLLKILSAAMRNDSEAVERVPFRRASVTFWAQTGGHTIRRTIERDSSIDFVEEEIDFDELALEPAGEGLWREIARDVRPSGWVSEVLTTDKLPEGFAERPFMHSYLPISRMNEFGRTVRTGNRPRVVDDAFLDEQFADQVRQRWQRYVSSALSQIRAIQQAGLASILAQLFGGGGNLQAVDSEEISAEEAYPLVSEFMREQHLYLRLSRNEFLRRYEEQSDLRTVVASIKAVTRQVDEVLRPQATLQHTIRRLYAGGKELQLDATEGVRGGSIRVQVKGQEIPLQSLSAGEKQLLRLMLEVLAANSSTVMIDEPELSMHVDWQQNLVSAMTSLNPECQLLLATHSPEVMADVPDEFVFQL